MNKVRIELENCYGIRKLRYIFDFNASKVFSIYAPNGFMKTSLSKTFQDYSLKQDSSDLIFPERVSTRAISDETQSPIDPESVYVIEPYKETFTSEKASLLLVNSELKAKYDQALQNIEKKKEVLNKKLKQLSGLTGRTITPETELLKVFGGTSLLELLESLEAQSQMTDKRFSSLVYSEIFNEKTVPILESGEIRVQIKEYIEKYNELIKGSPVLSKSFNHYHAKTVQKNLADNGFFSAKHSVNLFDGKTKEEIQTAEQFDEKIETEKRRILSNDSLLKAFESIDKKLSNADLRKFRDYLFDNKDILVELANFKEFQKKIWLSYLANQKDLFDDLLSEFKVGKKVIKEAIDAAKLERTEWQNVVEIFNKRFSVPFNIEVSNQDDVILKGSSPTIKFTFSDAEGSACIEKHALLNVLSQGEKRALYILNILFDLNVRISGSIKTLLIVDDIADSFDYKNKYAIIEYLKDVSRDSNFRAIFLTHNFDFHRTVSSRLNIGRENRLFACKGNNEFFLRKEKYQKDPFDYWKKNLSEPKYAISTIPFVRNLAKYCGMNNEYLKLTSVLHLKQDSRNLKMSDLQTIYFAIIKEPSDFSLSEPQKIVVDHIHEVAEQILLESDDIAELESKIILSISIRLCAEDFMIRKIADQRAVNEITEYQTQKLFEMYITKFPNDFASIKSLEKVILMTPENIHINSFMFEPILDMAAHHLKNLYREMKELNA